MVGASRSQRATADLADSRWVDESQRRGAAATRDPGDDAGAEGLLERKIFHRGGAGRKTRGGRGGNHSIFRAGKAEDLSPQRRREGNPRRSRRNHSTFRGNSGRSLPQRRREDNPRRSRRNHWVIASNGDSTRISVFFSLMTRCGGLLAKFSATSAAFALLRALCGECSCSSWPRTPPLYAGTGARTRMGLLPRDFKSR